MMEQLPPRNPAREAEGDDATTRHQLYGCLLEVLEDRLENLEIASNPSVMHALALLIVEAVQHHG
jgi:hypothetical protein